MIERQSPGPPAPNGRARIVVAHDWLCGVRGGEHVLERICSLVEREFEPAGLMVMVNDGRPIGDSVDRWVGHGLLRTSWLNGPFRAAPWSRRWLLPFYPSAVGHLGQALDRIHRRQRVDLVISTSSAAIKGLRPPAGVPHVCICFSPARYVWGDPGEYGADGTIRGALRGIGLRILGGRFRAWDRQTASNVTRFVAISRHVQQRISDAYQATSTIIYPPVRTGFFTIDPDVEREDFWLCVGALEPYKRTDLAVLAAQRSGAALKVAGDGSQASRLRRLAGSSSRIEFLGRVSDDALRALYRRARLLVFPQVEDFGIVPLEAQACGLPVVARGQGGALDTVLDGTTGALFSGAHPDAIVEATTRIPRDHAACRAQAERFSEQRFDAAVRDLLRSALAAAQPGASPR